MNFEKIPRSYLLGTILVMVLILVTVTVIEPGLLSFQDNTNYNAQKQAAADEAKQYEDLLASVQPDYQASQQFLEKVATDDIVRQQVEDSLDVKQKVTVPIIADSELNISDKTDRGSVVNYLNKLSSIITNYNNDVQPALNQTFADQSDPTLIAAANTKTQTLTDNIRGLPVPKDAVPLQKAYLATYKTYDSFLGTASQYAQDTTIDPWASVYGQYTAINSSLATSTTELKKLSDKYALNVPMPEDFANSGNHFPFIKVAQAQWPVVDVQQVIEVAIRTGLARAFAKFSITMLDKTVGHIEKSFAIASQLYYSQDLGRYYSVEYMKKFVSDPIDQDVIQKFLPQYFCINAMGGDLKKIFTAKARANQGADIVIDPNDPQFLTKLAKLGGDEKNYPGWWEDYYSSLAAQTQQQADAAATKEVTSPGLKSGRDLVNGEIAKTASAIFNVQEAAISGTINLGTNNTENIVGQLVSTVVENLVNKYVFTPIGGGTSGSGGIGVIKEQNVCLRTPQIKPITPVPSSVYNAPASTTTTTTVPTSTTTPPFVPR